jgi:hypothetical protein
MLAFLYKPASRAAVLATVLVLTAALAVIIANSWSVSFSGRADAYGAGEWLINYGGGFVRRGLGGSAILWAADISGFRPRRILFAILVTCYVMTFLPLVLIATRERELTLLDLLLTVSPFAALFPAFHFVAGERKEILLLALAGIAYVTRLGRLDSAAKYLFWSAALAVAIAVHDGLIFFLPLFILYLRALTPPNEQIGYRAAWIVMPAAGVFLAGYAYSSHADIAAICSTLQRHEPGTWCVQNAPGEFVFAASWLRATAADGVRSVLNRYTALSALRTLLIGSAGLPLIALAWLRDCSRKSADSLYRGADLLFSPWYFGLCLASMAVVFAVANDWNRWLYILSSLATMTYFAVRRRAARELLRESEYPGQAAAGAT